MKVYSDLYARSIILASGNINLLNDSSITIHSTALIANLNSQYLNGKSSSDFSLVNHTHNSLISSNFSFNLGVSTWNANNGEANILGSIVDSSLSGDSRLMIFSDAGMTNVYIDGEIYMGTNKYKVWHAGNTLIGTGSGLDADKLDGYHATSLNSINTIPIRDANGNINSTKFTGELIGNADTATAASKLKNAIEINSLLFDGSANLTIDPYVEVNETDNLNKSLVFSDNSASGFNRLNKDTSLTYNPSTGDLTLTGTLYASSKSFLIKHPTKKDAKLKYGSLEGPENGVYIRGHLKDKNIIELPYYWSDLVDMDTITVNLTPIGEHQKLCVKKIENNMITIKNDNLFSQKKVDCYFTVFAERKDIAKLETEVY